MLSRIQKGVFAGLEGSSILETLSQLPQFRHKPTTKNLPSLLTNAVILSLSDSSHTPCLCHGAQTVATQVYAAFHTHSGSLDVLLMAAYTELKAAYENGEDGDTEQAA